MRYLLIGLFLVSPLQAQTVPVFTDLDRAEKVRATEGTVDQKFREYAERQHMPGFAYGVVVDGELVYAGGFGYANIAGMVPADTRSLFRVASMSKSVTAMAILQLRDAGQLSLDDPIDEIPARDARPDVPDDRRARDHDPALADPFRRVPRGQSVGRPPAGRFRRGIEGADRGRHFLLQRGRTRVRIQQSRLRAVGAGRPGRLRDGFPRVHEDPHLRAARHDRYRVGVGGSVPAAAGTRLRLGRRCVGEHPCSSTTERSEPWAG